MIQRIQSLFLLAVVILQIIFVSTPVVHFLLNDTTVIDMYTSGFRNSIEPNVNLVSTLPLNILCWAIMLLTIVSIFLYKRRVLQLRICTYNILLDLGLIIMLAMQIKAFKSHNMVDNTNFTLAIVIPLANAILHFLAFRGIRKDELLVKAYDRLR